METYNQSRPLYIRDGSIEKEILDGAEAYFAERGENLRYDLVKRVFQWMLDTDENGVFEPTDMSEHWRWTSGSGIRESNKEMRLYLSTLREDVRTDCLTDEMKVTDAYIELIKPVLPAKYQERREFIHDVLNPEDRLERLRRIGEGYWYNDGSSETKWISI